MSDKQFHTQGEGMSMNHVCPKCGFRWVPYVGEKAEGVICFRCKMMTDTCPRCEVIRQKAEIERLRQKLHTKSVAQRDNYERMSAYWRAEINAGIQEIARLREQVRIEADKAMMQKARAEHLSLNLTESNRQVLAYRDRLEQSTKEERDDREYGSCDTSVSN